MYKLKYFCFKNESTVYVEGRSLSFFKYDNALHKWIDGTFEVWDVRVGIDRSKTPVDSKQPRSCLKEEVNLTKEEAEKMIGDEIDERALDMLLYQAN